MKRDRRFFELSSYNSDQDLLKRLISEFPRNTYIIILNDNTKNLEKKLRKIEGAPVYAKTNTKQ